MENTLAKDPIVDIDIKVCREDKEKTNRLQLFVTVWLTISNLEIRNVTEEDISSIQVNKEIGIMQVNVHLDPIPNNTVTEIEKPVAISRFIDFKNEDPKNPKFEFELNKNFILLVNIISDVRPTGTKRRVIVYEDADIIDDTKL